MTSIHSLAVFCGSRLGTNPVYAEAGRVLGRGLAEAGIRLVYGGGRIGIMGVVADAVLEAGGTVLGVIPGFLVSREVGHSGLTNLAVTESMHMRKVKMYEEADAFLIMPGGLGTLDETFEILTWRQLGLHDKPILLCDVAGWATGLLQVMSQAVEQGFADAASPGLVAVFPDVAKVIEHLKNLDRGSGSTGGVL
jgi:hypothetical protein